MLIANFCQLRHIYSSGYKVRVRATWRYPLVVARCSFGGGRTMNLCHISPLLRRSYVIWDSRYFRLLEKSFHLWRLWTSKMPLETACRKERVILCARLKLPQSMMSDPIRPKGKFLIPTENMCDCHWEKFQKLFLSKENYFIPLFFFPSSFSSSSSPLPRNVMYIHSNSVLTSLSLAYVCITGSPCTMYIHTSEDTLLVWYEYTIHF